ncbi:hypothetical protein [Nostoc commune]|uniref:hypothetical protein n=1 Tax=Nostoc commune TaxID=1178 RepID=UPI0018C5A72D|nr:hypothetical protein [Nostoc commune]
MNNEKTKKTSENEVLNNTVAVNKNIEQPVVQNSIQPEVSKNNSRSPGKDRGG